MILLLLIPAIVTSVVGSLVYKKNDKPSYMALFSNIVWGVIIGAVSFGLGFILFDDVFANITWATMGMIIFQSVIGSLCVLTWAKGVKDVPCSIADPFSQMRMFFMLGISWLIFNDTATSIDIILVCVIFLACMTMGIWQYKSEQHKGSKKYFWGLLWLCVWVLLSTANLGSMRMIADNGVHITTFVFFSGFITALICLPVFFFTKKINKETLQCSFKDKWLAGIGITDNIWILFYIPLAMVLNLGVLDAIMVVAPALVVVFGLFLFREKIKWYIYPLIVIILGCAIALSLLST